LQTAAAAAAVPAVFVMRCSIVCISRAVKTIIVLAPSQSHCTTYIKYAHVCCRTQARPPRIKRKVMIRLVRGGLAQLSCHLVNLSMCINARVQSFGLIRSSRDYVIDLNNKQNVK